MPVMPGPRVAVSDSPRREVHGADDLAVAPDDDRALAAPRTQREKSDVRLVEPVPADKCVDFAGAEIDYKDDLEGAQFVIRNPNATTTCGCGSSFTV